MSDEHTRDLVNVLLDEEYGYRQWFWRTGMTREELVAFWKALPTMEPYFFSPKGLPGNLEQIRQGADEAPEDFWLRYEGLQAQAGWTGHIHMDDDSFLLAPDGSEINHAGYTTTEGKGAV